MKYFDNLPLSVIFLPYNLIQNYFHILADYYIFHFRKVNKKTGYGCKENFTKRRVLADTAPFSRNRRSRAILSAEFCLQDMFL